MKLLILPAVSALLFAGLPVQAQSLHVQSFQIADNNSGHDQGNQDRAGKGGAKGDNQKGAGNAGGQGRGSSMGGAAIHTPSALGSFNQGGTAAGTVHTVRGHRGTTATTGGFNQGAATTGSFNQGGAGTNAVRVHKGGTATTGGFNQGGAAVGTNAVRVHKGGTATTGGFNQGGAAAGTNRAVTITSFGTRPANWNKYPRQFDHNVYQRNVTASRSYHWQSYNRPSGWYYQRWVFGQIFPRIFWAQDYWLNDYWMFDLPIPPYGYVWVRYGDDAVLINRRTGEVLQVEYGLFD